MIKNTVDLGNSEEIASSSGAIIQSVIVKEDADYNIDTFEVVDVANGEAYKNLQGIAPYTHSNSQHILCRLTEELFITYESYNSKDSYCSIKLRLKKLNAIGDCTEISSTLYQMMNNKNYTLQSNTTYGIRVSDTRCYFVCNDSRYNVGYLVRVDVVNGTSIVCTEKLKNFSGVACEPIKLSDNYILQIIFNNTDATETWYKINPQDDSITSFTFSRDLLYAHSSYYRISDTAFIGLYSNKSDEAYYGLYDVSDNAVTKRGARGWYANEYGKITGACELWDGLVLTCGRRGSGHSVLTVLNCNGTEPLTVSQIQITQPVDASYAFGLPTLVRTTSGIYCMYKDIPNKKVLISEVIVSTDGSTISVNPKAVIRNDSSYTSNFISFADVINDTIMIDPGTNGNDDAYHYFSSYIFLRQWRDTFVNHIENHSTQAIALIEGSAGDRINVIFSGEVKAPCATGFKITSAGVNATCNIDGWLKVTGHWESGETAKIESGSYVGTGAKATSISNALSLTFDFSPKFFFIAEDGVFKLAASGYKHAFWMKGLSTIYTGSNTSQNAVFTVDGNTLSWYGAGGVEYYYNELGATYHYIAIG